MRTLSFLTFFLVLRILLLGTTMQKINSAMLIRIEVRNDCNLMWSQNSMHVIHVDIDKLSFLIFFKVFVTDYQYLFNCIVNSLHIGYDGMMNLWCLSNKYSYIRWFAYF